VKFEVGRKSRKRGGVTAAMALSYTRSSTDTLLGESRNGYLRVSPMMFVESYYIKSRTTSIVPNAHGTAENETLRKKVTVTLLNLRGTTQEDQFNPDLVHRRNSCSSKSRLWSSSEQQRAVQCLRPM
jgi:hypothetical protein